jgi:hypothetical protein
LKNEIPKKLSGCVSVVYFEPLYTTVDSESSQQKKMKLTEPEQEVSVSPILQVINKCYKNETENSDRKTKGHKIVSGFYQIENEINLDIPFIQYDEKTSSALDSSTTIAQKNSILLVSGAQKIGKSTSCRYIVNRLLSKFGVVAFLDLDPSSPEFGSRGTLSLTIVKNPLLGPNFTNHIYTATEAATTVIRTLYFGHTSLDADIDYYMKCCVELFNDYATTYRNPGPNLMPLVVQTANSVHAPAMECLLELVRIIQPNFIHHIRYTSAKNEEEVITHDKLASTSGIHYTFNLKGPYPPMTLKKLKQFLTIHYLSVPHQVAQRSKLNNSSLHQHLIMAQYLTEFGKNLPRALIDGYLNKDNFGTSDIQRIFSDIPYYRVSWNKFCIAFSNELHRESAQNQERLLSHIMYKLNASIVALATTTNLSPVQNEQQDGNEYPTFVTTYPANSIFIGTAFIRHICPVEKKFYIITSVPQSELQKVNLMLSGSVTISYLFTRQVEKHSFAKPYFISEEDEMEEKAITAKMNTQEGILRNAQMNQTRKQKIA